MAVQIAVLDLGATTFHLQHFDMQAAGLTCTFDRKVTARLGEHVSDDGQMDPRAWSLAVEAIEGLLEASASQGADQLAVVATSPFRRATRGAELAKQLERQLGVRVTILSARQEAALAYLGNVAGAAGIRRRAVVDVGGGSAEIAVGDGAHCLFASSVPLGAVHLRRGYSTQRPFGVFEARDLRRRLPGLLSEAAQTVTALEPRVLTFASGTARAVRGLVTRGQVDEERVGALSLRALRRGLERHLGSRPEQLEALGVDPARADTVLVGAVVMEGIAAQLGLADFRVSDRGLRHGVATQVMREAQDLGRRREATAVRRIPGARLRTPTVREA